MIKSIIIRIYADFAKNKTILNNNNLIELDNFIKNQKKKEEELKHNNEFLEKKSINDVQKLLKDFKYFEKPILINDPDTSNNCNIPNNFLYKTNNNLNNDNILIDKTIDKKYDNNLFKKNFNDIDLNINSRYYLNTKTLKEDEYPYNNLPYKLNSNNVYK